MLQGLTGGRPEVAPRIPISRPIIPDQLLFLLRTTWTKHQPKYLPGSSELGADTSHQNEGQSKAKAEGVLLVWGSH